MSDTTIGDVLDNLPAAAAPEVPKALGVEMERAICGTLLANPDELDAVTAQGLQRRHFGHHTLAAIFDAISHAAERGPVDALTVAQVLEERGQLEWAGGRAGLDRLEQSLVGSATVSHYVAAVMGYATRRAVLAAAAEMAAAARDPSQDPKTVQAAAEAAVFAIGEGGAAELRPFGDHIADAMRQAERASQQQGVSGVPSGFGRLDALTMGFQPGDLVILAARPSMGKSALAACFAMNATSLGYPAAFISLEMPATSLALRAVAAEGRVSLGDLRRGSLDRAGWHQAASAAGVLSERALWIDDRGGQTPAEIASTLRRLVRREGIQIAFVDYLQHVTSPIQTDNKTVAVGEISAALKRMARELHIPIVALAQLNRGVESRQDKRPMLSDLRDSGNIEQDADLVLMLYRGDRYEKDESKHDGLAELNIAKHRNGALDTLTLAWRASHTRFDEEDT